MFCPAGHVDIRIPIFHFSTKKYSRNLLAHAPELNALHPWESKKPLLFGRFSNYYRHIHPNVTVTLRHGAGGSSICKLDSPSTLSCRVRQHMFEFAKKHKELMDIKSAPQLPLLDHAKYKYVLSPHPTAMLHMARSACTT